MKERQGPTGTDALELPSLPAHSERNSPSTKGSGNSLLLLQLRTELEGKWRPDKLGILRRWINVSPKHWFCQKEDAYDYALRPSMIIRNVRKSNGQRQSRRKQKPRCPSSSKTPLGDRFVQQALSGDENNNGPEWKASTGKTQRRARRFSLEEEVMVLQKRFQGEVDLHLALESVICPSSGACPRRPEDLPLSTLELLEEIAELEEAVAELEDRSATLQSQIGKERNECTSLKRRSNVSKCSCEGPVASSVISSEQLRHAKPHPMGQQLTEHSPSDSAATKPASPLTLGDYLRDSSVGRADRFSSTCEHCGSCNNADALVIPPVQASAVPRSKEASGLSPLPLKSRGSDTSCQESSSGMVSSDSISSKHSFLSAFDPHNRVQSSAALLQDSAMPFSFSPARYLYSSGASTSDQSGFCGTPSSGAQDHSNSSPLVPGLSNSTSSPDTPEHRGRPSSPTVTSDQGSGLRYSGADSPSEETYSIPKSRRFQSSPDENHSSSAWSYPPEEFHTPKTSSSLADHLSGDSQPSSGEKRSKVRVKLSLQAEDMQAIRKNPNALDKSHEADNAAARSLVCELLSPGEEFDILPIGCPGGADGKYHFRDYSQTPNLLSEEMIKCMISIYCHLADPAVILRNRSSYDTMPSPTSHFGHTPLSSFSSESSLLSFVRSPLVDLRNKDDILGCDSSPDPYKVRDRIPWADVGVYSKVLEVPWMTVNKDQLGYAAQALFKFRLLVEQLPDVDPQYMSHSAKLAFWLNLYNALMMHAYLAYGIPRNDLKYFALLQKATYNVGGHTFSAATIEFSLLRGKTPSYRPQIGLLFALHKNKLNLTEAQLKFAVDYPEPQMVFALCCGARSSPAVRVYTAGQIHQELNLALRDYARAAVGMNGKGKLLVPKLLYTYAHEFVEDGAFLDWICQLLPVNQAGLVMECWQHRHNRLLGARKFAVLPFELRFRYLFSPLQPLW